MNTAVLESHLSPGTTAVIQSPDLTDAQLIDSVNKFKEKNPNATPEQLTAFEVKVRSNILESRLKSVGRISGTGRITRQSKVHALARSINAQFAHTRARTVHRKDLTAEFVFSTGRDLRSEKFILETPTIANQGGATIAYILKTDDQNRLFAHYSVAICRADENFDALVGREFALERLIAGQTLAFELNHGGLRTFKLTEKDVRTMIRRYSDYLNGFNKASAPKVT